MVIRFRWPRRGTSHWPSCRAVARGRPAAAAVRLLRAGTDLPELIGSDEMMRSLLKYDPVPPGEKVMIGRLIREVTRFALAEVDPATNTIQLHRLVQTVIRNQMTTEESD